MLMRMGNTRPRRETIACRTRSARLRTSTTGGTGQAIACVDSSMSQLVCLPHASIGMRSHPMKWKCTRTVRHDDIWHESRESKIDCWRNYSWRRLF